VIDASGTWQNPNVLGGDGLAARGEQQARAAGLVFPSALPDLLGADRARFAGARVLVAGAGHSATNTLISLAQLVEQDPTTRAVWAIRGRLGARVFGGGEDDALPARGALGSRLRALVESGRVELLAGFSIDALRIGDSGVTVTALDGREVTVNRIVSATGFRPDHTLAGELPHGQRELAHPEPGYYAVGTKSYGRAPTFLMTTGYEQVRSIVAFLDGDLEAAAEVRLELPETGVCSSNPDESVGDASGGCCGAPPARGLATGIRGGLLSAPLPLLKPGSRSGSCG
jgi:hypothetical protein